MKTLYHIPTEQYGFIEVEADVYDTRSYEDVKALYIKSITPPNSPNSPEMGIPTKEFNQALDEFLTTNTLKDGANLYEQMSLPQRSVFQEIKKSLARISSKEDGHINKVHHSLKK